MRRSFAAVVAALSMSVSVLAAAPSTAADDTSPAAPSTPGALDRARDVLAGVPAARTGAHPSATLALRDLFVALPSLGAAERKEAQGLLARPTQGPNDPNDDGYTVESRRTCSKRICLHWVPSTNDAPPSRAWVDRNLAVMKRTWAREVGKLGYRRPVKDGSRGGNDKFDVYLKDVGSEGFYGYCAPERRRPGHKWQASGYCVLDDDFARSQFGARPSHSLRVTAAHEFFHAVQFAYDYGEDRWLMEASATWMEERVADDVNDNRQYLRHGQVSQPGDPLDLFNPQGFDQYGNWVFLEFLSQRYGVGVVRRIWNESTGSWRNYSLKAVKAVLPRSTSFRETFRAYAAANTMAGRSYSEGRSWPAPGVAASHTLRPDQRSASGAVRIDHLASRTVVVKPADDLTGRRWTLRLRVDGPARGSSPAAYVLVHKAGGKVARKAVVLDRGGEGQKVFRFESRSVRKATVVLANASTRSDCWEQDTTYSCQGLPRDDGKRFSYALRVRKG